MDGQVIVGTIGRAHGLRGEVRVRPRTDSVEQRFAPGATVIADSRRLIVTRQVWQQGYLVISFEGVNDRSAAEALRGIDLWAEGAGEPTSPEEYHDTALIGLAAVDPSGSPLGEVVEMQHLPAQDLLLIRLVSGEQRQVPFVAALVPSVDLEAGRIVIDPIPGLLDGGDDAD